MLQYDSEDSVFLLQMDTPDNTVILRMKKDFRTFLSGGSRPSMDGSAPALCPLSFNVSDLQGGLDTSKADSQCQSSSKLRSSVSMKSLLGKFVYCDLMVVRF